MKKIRLNWLVGLASMWVATTALGEETIKVALNIPLSGPFANIGELYVNSAQFAIDDINARGGVMGKKFEVVAFDNKNSPQDALLVLKRITDQQIRFMIQSGGSHVAVPLAEATARHNERNPDNRLLFLDEPGDQDLSNEKCNFWTFTFMANQEVKMEALTNHLARKKDVKRVYLFNQDYLFGQQIRKYAREMLARKRPDITIVGDDLHPLGKIKDFAPYIAKISASKADTIITGNWGADMTLLVKAAADSGLNAKFYTYYGLGPGALTVMGKSAIGRMNAIWRWHGNLPIAKELDAADRYKRRFNLEYYAMPINNIFDMLKVAVERAASTDALKVAYALEDVRIQTGMGEAWMRPEDHQLFEPLYILSMAEVDGVGVKYDVENTGVGTVADERVEVKDQLLPTQCKMVRPPKP